MLQRLAPNMTRRLTTIARQLRGEEDGVNLVIVAILMVTLLGFAGIGIDGSNVYFQRQRVQIAADAAAMGGARLLAIGATEGQVHATIIDLAVANGADTATWSYINDGKGVHVEAKRTFEAFFAQIYGTSYFDVYAVAEAQYEPVTAADGLFPLTLPCDCVGEDGTINIGDPDNGSGTGGSGGGSGSGGGTGGSGGGSGSGGGTGGSGGDSGSGGSGSGGSGSGSGGAPIANTIDLDDNFHSSYEISLLSNVGNTWNYRVREIDGRDLSHWSLGIVGCLDKIASFSPSGAEVGVDGSTGFNGIKWNVNDGFSVGDFSITLNSNYPAGIVQAMMKAGTESAIAGISGPICDGSAGGGSSGGGSGGSGSSGPALCLPTIDFESSDAGAGLVRGQKIDNEWSAWGVNVTTNNPSSHPAMIFDSSSPTGGDNDLGSPNQSYGGPGVGAGGASGQPGKNSNSAGKVLIISENNSSTNPDDNSNGGTIFFTFDTPVRIDEVHILDMDNEEIAGWVNAYNETSGGDLIKSAAMLGMGDNSYQIVEVKAVGVRRLEINLPGGGGVPAIVSCASQQLARYEIGHRIWSDLDFDGIQDPGEPGIPGVKLELYIQGASHVVDSVTTDGNGEYLFTGLPAGVYEVKVASSNFSGSGPLVGTLNSPKDATSDNVDSDFNSSTQKALAAVPFDGGHNHQVDGGFMTPLPPPNEGEQGPTTTTVNLNDNRNTKIKIEFISRTGRTWKYKVTEVQGRDLSHWNLGGSSYWNCINHIVSYSPNGADIGKDGSTGFWGIKWNVNDNFSNGFFEFTLDNDYAYTTVKALAKAGTKNASKDINGPDCDVPLSTSTPTPTPTPTPTATSSDNPDVTLQCGMDFIMVLDHSTSIDIYGNINNVRNAARAFVDGLADTGSWMTVVEFGTTAQRVKINNSTAFMEITADYADSDNDDFEAYINGGSGSSGYDPSDGIYYTNWEDALREVANIPSRIAGRTPYVIFFTDGNPTAAGDPPWWTDSSASGIAQSVPPARTQADVVKGLGRHIFVVALDDGTSGGIPIENIVAISGGIAYPSGSANVGVADYMVFSNGAQLQEAFGQIAAATCGVTVAVNKKVDNDNDGSTADEANNGNAPGWIFQGDAAVGGAEAYIWQSPSVTVGSHRRGTTDANGNVTFSWRYNPSSSTAASSLVVSEEPDAGAQTNNYYMKSFTCSMPDGASYVSSIETRSATLSGLQKSSAYSCQVVNARKPNISPSCEDTGSLSSSAHPDADDPNILGRVRNSDAHAQANNWKMVFNIVNPPVGQMTFENRWSSALETTCALSNNGRTATCTLNSGVLPSNTNWDVKMYVDLSGSDPVSVDVTVDATNDTGETSQNVVVPAQCAETTASPPPSSEPNACVFRWLDWNGGTASNMELRNDMLDTSRSGARQLGDEIAAGPPASSDALVSDGLNANVGKVLLVPLANWDGDGYIVCGFARIRLLDYDFASEPRWVSFEYVDDLVRGLITSPTATDYGARDVVILK